MANKEGTWLSISDYSRFKSLSISTIRRKIKAGHLKYKFEDGKYEIFTPLSTQEINSSINNQIQSLVEENKALKKINSEMSETINELEMLVKLYENQMTPPPLPNYELYS